MNAIGLWAIAADSPDAAAVIEPDGTEVSYAQLAAEADRYGRGFQALGLRPGSSVAFLLPNSATALAVIFAALETGLYVVPLNWHLVAAELAYILRDCGAEAFVAHERFAEAAAQAADTAGIAERVRFAVGSVPGFTPLSELGAEGSGRPDQRTSGAPMMYTSGTSGRPKGVRRELTGTDPDGPPVNAMGFFSIFSLAPFDGHVHLCCSPLYHTAVLNFTTMSLQLGHPVVMMDGFDAAGALRLIARHRVTHTHMVPTQFRRLLALPAGVREAHDVSSLRTVIHSAAPCPGPVKRQMIDWWGPVIVEYYAATEGGGTVITAQEWLDRPGSVGRPWPHSEVRVVDDAGQDQPPGEPGLVYMRMGTSTFTYHQDQQKTQAAWMDGAFTVGDIGYLDADGYLFLCDRKSDMIISGGVNIYPAEIESELACHRAVADVAVFGIPHEEWGEEIKAVVEPVAGVEAGPALTEELLAFLGGRVARFKLPRSIDYVSELPRDPNGKLLKRRLRDRYWAGRERAI
ncbi:MAG TPA: acyl-CoA synthetase [Streptosporangiaceae bacterium]|nr:acyl-CoA synthetase [Streptosporangiaceae bacterium]